MVGEGSSLRCGASGAISTLYHVQRVLLHSQLMDATGRITDFCVAKLRLSCWFDSHQGVILVPEDVTGSGYR